MQRHYLFRLLFMGKCHLHLLVVAMAVVGFYEILKMKGISIFSIPGVIGVLTLVLLVIPNNWASEVLQAIGYYFSLNGRVRLDDFITYLYRTSEK